MKLFEFNYFKEIPLENGQVHYCLDEIVKTDTYGIDLTEDNKLIFCFNEKTSNPIEVIYDSSYAWKGLKTCIKANRPASKLFETFCDPFWNCYLYHFCKGYVLNEWK